MQRELRIIIFLLTLTWITQMATCSGMSDILNLPGQVVKVFHHISIDNFWGDLPWTPEKKK